MFLSSTLSFRVEYTTTQTPQEKASTVTAIPPSAFTTTAAVTQSYEVPLIQYLFNFLRCFKLSCAVANGLLSC